MKVLHVVSSLDPNSGGPAQVAVRLAAAQAAAGNETAVLCYGDSSSDGRIKQAIGQVPGASRVQYEHIWNTSFVERIAGIRAARAASALVKRVDWVHCHGIWEPLVFHAMRQAMNSGVGYCVRPAGMLSPWSLAQKSIKKSLALACGYRHALDHASFIHALNNDEARLMAKVNLRPPICVVPNGIFVEEVLPLPAYGRFRQQHPQLGSDPYVLFLGRLHYVKGLDILVPAFEKLAHQLGDVRLVIAGPDYGELPRLKRALDASRFKDRILLVGPLYGTAKFEALVDASVFCLPSRQEGFSVAVLEALASGLPAVVSEQVNFPEIAEAGAGIVASLEVTAISSALARVLSDASARRSMSAAAQRLVLERFTWPSVSDQLISLYSQHAVH